MVRGSHFHTADDEKGRPLEKRKTLRN
ncbi:MULTISPECIES: hypothetical protein [Bacillus cereus group]|nr:MULTISPECIES: hypothetical protein [Bacillus cereus group]